MNTAKSHKPMTEAEWAAVRQLEREQQERYNQEALRKAQPAFLVVELFIVVVLLVWLWRKFGMGFIEWFGLDVAWRMFLLRREHHRQDRLIGSMHLLPDEEEALRAQAAAHFIEEAQKVLRKEKP